MLRVGQGNRTRNGSGGLGRWLVRPEPEYRPAEGSQTVVRVCVPSLVRFDLLPPELRIPFRPCGVLGTAMPEAAIDEDGDLATGESDIGNTTRFLQNLVVDSVAQTDSMHLSAQR